ncbi:hypothetical protein M0R45_009311 [Rubus argutus]|uniref:Uncharacterized protein n=1 Tax=Rubus argutus TaxID=59490 RepID=A0AAW1Y6N5_RUBAR
MLAARLDDLYSKTNSFLPAHLAPSPLQIASPLDSDPKKEKASSSQYSKLVEEGLRERGSDVGSGEGDSRSGVDRVGRWW